MRGLLRRWGAWPTGQCCEAEGLDKKARAPSQVENRALGLSTHPGSLRANPPGTTPWALPGESMGPAQTVRLLSSALVSWREGRAVSARSGLVWSLPDLSMCRTCDFLLTRVLVWSPRHTVALLPRTQCVHPAAPWLRLTLFPPCPCVCTGL